MAPGPQASPSRRNFLLARTGPALAVAGSRRPGGGRRFRRKALARRRRPRTHGPIVHARVALPYLLVQAWQHGWAHGPRPRWWVSRDALRWGRARNGITQRAREGDHLAPPPAGGLCRRRCGCGCACLAGGKRARDVVSGVRAAWLSARVGGLPAWLLGRRTAGFFGIFFLPFSQGPIQLIGCARAYVTGIV